MKKKAVGLFAAAMFLGAAVTVTALACFIKSRTHVVEVHLFTPEEMEGKEDEIEKLIPKEKPTEKTESEEA